MHLRYCSLEALRQFARKAHHAHQLCLCVEVGSLCKLKWLVCENSGGSCTDTEVKTVGKYFCFFDDISCAIWAWAVDILMFLWLDILDMAVAVCRYHAQICCDWIFLFCSFLKCLFQLVFILFPAAMANVTVMTSLRMVLPAHACATLDGPVRDTLILIFLCLYGLVVLLVFLPVPVRKWCAGPTCAAPYCPSYIFGASGNCNFDSLTGVTKVICNDRNAGRKWLTHYMNVPCNLFCRHFQ